MDQPSVCQTSVMDLLLKRPEFDDEGFVTRTSLAQKKVEASVKSVYALYDKTRELIVNPSFPELKQNLTKHFLLKTLNSGTPFQVYDCNRAWLCYWILQGLDLMGHQLECDEKLRIVNFLNICQNKDGGFGGGPFQFSHLAPTYAAVNAVCILGTEEAYKMLDREALLHFLWRLRVGDGSFYMHIGGEIDMRSAYCAIAVAKLTNLYSEALFKGTAEWITRCQTYEGGFSGTPGMEAHGGYTFCGLAALYLLNCPQMCDFKALLRWLTNRQMSYEGGFQGRTNKLVDSCYSFWQAGAVAIANMVLLSDQETKQLLKSDSWLFECNLLQEYVLICCQHKGGGLVDKPNEATDAYHTCYALSGLSVAQNLPNGTQNSIGSEENLLEPVHPAHNITIKKFTSAKKYFSFL